MKKIIIICLLLKTSFSIAQSKNEQIETLKIRVDSLNAVLNLERNTANQNVFKLNYKITDLESKIEALNLTIKNSQSLLQKKELEYENLNVKFDKTNKDLVLIRTKLDSLLDSLSAVEFVTKFYSSLELSPELNEKHYNEGGIMFNLKTFNSCIDINSVFSKNRISNLTGNYHDRYYIELLTIDYIKLNSNVIEVITTVEYRISEVGRFVNEEKIIININRGNLTLNTWEDLKIKNMEVAEYEGLENFSEFDFYKIIGSFNK